MTCPVCEAAAKLLANAAALAQELDPEVAPGGAVAARQLAEGLAIMYREAREGCEQ